MSQVLGQRENRRFTGEVRMANDGKTIEGYAALYNSWSQDLGGFREIIRPGAFDAALAREEDRDRQCLWNHDTRLILGRESNRTLELGTDEKGLWFRATPPPTSYWINDLKPLMANGYVNQCSFSFLILDGKNERWTGDYSERELLSIDRLFEVTVCTEGAYLEPSVAIRAAAMQRPQGTDPANLWELNLRQAQLQLLILG